MRCPGRTVKKMSVLTNVNTKQNYTLNFAVTAETKLNAQHLTNLFDPAMFIVKITPIHETNAAKANGITTDGGYDRYDVYRQFEEPLLQAGWDVIVFVPSKEEDNDRITCGNALLASMKNTTRTELTSGTNI